MEFFFVCGFWSGHPVEVGRDPFAPYTRELWNLSPEGILFVVAPFIYIYIYIYIVFLFLFLLFILQLLDDRP